MARQKNFNRVNLRKKRKWKPGGAFDMEQLPLAVVMDILSRLSFKNLCNCRCVCKDWLHMISDPQFAHLHCLRSPISILVKTSPLIREQRKLDLIHLEKTDGSRMRVDRMRFAPQNSIPCSFSTLLLMNSCNGFVCLSESKRDGSLYVCNPILGQYISIPSPDKNRDYYGNFTAIGFSAKTKEYKVVQTSFVDCNRIETVAKIYTIGTGVWRSLGKPPRGRLYNIPFNPFLHGALHWIPYDDCPSQSIQSFDFEREEIRPLLFPPVSVKKVDEYDGLRLGVLKGCLFLCVFDGDRKSDMWLMKNYGVQESWTKVLVIEHLYPMIYRGLSPVYEPILFLSDVEFLMTYDRFMVCYNTETKCLRKTSILRTKSRFKAFGYYPCFVSLHDVANGEEVKRIREGQ